MDEHNQKIEAAIIIEVVGRPPEHLVQTLKDIITKIDNEKGVKVRDKKINEPVNLKDSAEFFTSFAEIELELDNILTLSRIMFKYMPAHVDIITPEEIKMTNVDWCEVMNELLRRLHEYDEVVRIVQTEKKVLEKQLKASLEKKNKETEK
jgi:hypothetical protein